MRDVLRLAPDGERLHPTFGAMLFDMQMAALTNENKLFVGDLWGHLYQFSYAPDSGAAPTQEMRTASLRGAVGPEGLVYFTKAGEGYLYVTTARGHYKYRLEDPP